LVCVVVVSFHAAVAVGPVGPSRLIRNPPGSPRNGSENRMPQVSKIQQITKVIVIIIVLSIIIIIILVIIIIITTIIIIITTIIA
jgi:lipopolysaccharide/colanic/teichoic acid biosynthesis glycosyltransferase